ncbi:MAG TPA: twin-arginine translocation signal domain-containing protein [Burkholderiales bacterium]|nr:twin-arginine translocation signal domain-containing protein [Burkholderiales bacterium]
MNRRQFLALAGAASACALLSAHSPYRQWMVYRQTHLVILTSRDDDGADELGEKFAAVLRAALPDSRAAVARGPRVQRIASLISTRQAEVGVVARASAIAMYRGEPPFEQFGHIPLRVIVQDAAYQLICHEDFPPQHAYLMAEALTEDRGSFALTIPSRDSAGRGDVPPHVGALAFAEGLPLDLRDRQ